MGIKEYNIEEIWERLYGKVDLRNFEKAKNDKERLKEFKKALARDNKAKNLLKSGSENIKKLFDYGVAQRISEGDSNFKKSFNRFGEKRKRKISAFSGVLKKKSLEDQALDKAEKKGIGVREFKTRKSALGRPSKTTIKGKDVTVKRFKQGKNEYIGVWKKGRKGLITKIKV